MGNNTLLFESLLKKNGVAPGTKDFLKKIIEEHPYFSLAQFFLLLHTEPGTTEYNQQASKTAALFNNPYWLQFQLREMQESQGERNGQATLVDEPAGHHEHDNNVPAELNDENKTIAGLPIFINQAESAERSVTKKEDDAVSHEAFPQNERLDRDDTMPGSKTETGNSENISFDQPGISKEITRDPEEPIPVNENIEATGELIETGGEMAADKIEMGNESMLDGRSGGGEETINEKTSTISSENNHDKGLEKTGEITTINITEPAIESNTFDEDKPDEDDHSPNENEPLHLKLNIDVIDTPDEDISFEPLHMTDYFASQGIKISADIKPDDKLGKQLKSFTEWLKTMKKIHSEQLTQVNEATDATIQKLAEKSNKEDEVVTEAMAEVLQQQGKAAKAVEVYQKLSLLNPSKNAYFAAKIDQLKEH